MRNRISTGILVVAGIASVVWQQGAIALFLGAGLSITGLLATPKWANLVSRWTLQIGIVLLGLGLPFSEALALSSKSWLIVTVMVTLTLTAGLLLGWLLRVDVKSSQLLTTGTAVCGGTAVATMTPIIRASATQVAQVLTIIFLLNGVAIVAFPLIGNFFAMSEESFGLWVAIAIHDTSSVVGAAATYGDQALNTAVTIKVLRIFWLIPLIVLASMQMRRVTEDEIQIPRFIFVFILASILAGVIQFESGTIEHLNLLSKSLFCVALFLIGTQITWESLQTLSVRLVSMAITLWALLSISSLLWILSLS